MMAPGKTGSVRIRRLGRGAAVLGGTLACAAALTGCATPSSAVRTPATPFSAAGIDWPARGNEATNHQLTQAAMKLWDMKSGTGHSAEHALFVGDAGIAGVTDGQCGLVVLAGESSTGTVRIGWFVSPGKLTTTTLDYLGETKPASAHDELSLLTVAGCADPNASTHSPIPFPADSPNPNPSRSSSLRLLGLAAPGYELQAPSDEDTGALSSAPKGPAMSRDVVTDEVRVDLLEGPVWVRTFTVPFTPSAS